MPPSTDPSAFATRQLDLLRAEQAAEVAETAILTSTHAPTVLQRAGLALLNLHVSTQRTGFGGKTLLELSLDPAISTGELPEHGLRVGDICAVAEQPKGSERKKEREGIEQTRVTGVITKVRREDITVALDKEDAEAPSGAKLWLLKLSNESTHKRLNQTMTRLSKLTPGETSSLTDVLLGLSSPTPQQQDVNVKWIDDTLNDSQKAAIQFALASREVALIHGPPGTGKTHTLIELILQLISRKQRVLVCGPSNISVDNIVERLAKHKVSMVRLGHPARLLPSVLNHSLDILTRTSDAAAIVDDIRDEMDSKQASLRKTKSSRERRGIYLELKDLRKEFRQREARVVSDLLRTSQVVLATLHGAGGHHLKDQNFDCVIVDEASQALEAQCWIPVLSVKGVSKLILAGDHLQLPPTIKSKSDASKTKEASKVHQDGTKEVKLEDDDDSTLEETMKVVKLVDNNTTLSTTLFDRLLNLHGDNIKCMLTTQYRMHESIMRFPSAALYENKLIAADAVRERLLHGLPNVSETEDTTCPIVFWDTQGGEFPEQLEDTTTKGALLAESKVNPNEAALVKMHVSRLIEAGVKPGDIAIVTPYNGQLALLAAMLKPEYPGLEMGSVDGFQGREKEAIIVSLVRSNPEKEVGFLAEKRRLNVAMTRPKRHLCIIGDSESVGRTKFLKAWMSFLEDHADLRYPDVAEVLQTHG
ncbi:hypothetical protein AMS68_002017 [Peltaster fructicola]|uniref:DNA helicase n=1 Tax=Peltaster fructicola TaxID=286661 RepID=A0A6H0XPU2_9PEZI|nr:hypothetical protein AMS68_002017 [Peltaster fructicola]